MTAEAAHDNVANSSHSRPLEDGATEEIASVIIISIVSINDNRESRNIAQTRQLDCVEFVLA